MGKTRAEKEKQVKAKTEEKVAMEKVKRVSVVEKAVRHDVKQFLKHGLWTKFESNVDTDKAEDAYFEWYHGLDEIGGVAITHALKEMEILHKEHCERDTFEAYREEHGTPGLWKGVSLAMCITVEILEQLSVGLRHADERWSQDIHRLIMYGTDVAVIYYAIHTDMDLPEPIKTRC